MRSQCWVLLQFCCSRILMLAMLFSSWYVFFFPDHFFLFLGSVSSWASLYFPWSFWPSTTQTYSSRVNSCFSWCPLYSVWPMHIFSQETSLFVCLSLQSVCLNSAHAAEWVVTDGSKSKPLVCTCVSTGFIKTSCFRKTADSYYIKLLQ